MNKTMPKFHKLKVLRKSLINIKVTYDRMKDTSLTMYRHEGKNVSL